MKVGDLVKRSDTFKEWIKAGNAWMTIEEERELGLIVAIDEEKLVVSWAFTGISWEDENDVEIINEIG